jgi:AraC-like DNA-binding protein
MVRKREGFKDQKAIVLPNLIQNACQMLDFTNMHIKGIAAQLDFEDQFYFSGVFRKVMGLSPLEYRKRRNG